PAPRLEALTGDWTRALVAATLVAIVLFGGYLRLTHLNWDSNGNGISGHLHPDERFLTQIAGDTRAPSSIANYFDTKTSALNPYNITHPDGSKQTDFVYGTLPLFMNKFVASHLHVLSLGMLSNYDDYDGYNLAGRGLSAVIDIATIVFVFLLARELVDRRAGLLAAFLYALAPFAIQNAHFFIVDPYVAFFATASLLFAVRVAKYGYRRDMALAGVAAGLATACKITAVSMLPVIVLAIGVYCWPAVKPYVAPWWYGKSKQYRAQQDGRRLDAAVANFVIGSLIALVTAFVAFRIAMPYAFQTPSIGQLFSWNLGSFGPIPVPYPDMMNHHWLQNEVDQHNLLSGAAFPPNVQWIARSKWLWPLQQIVDWGMGPALGITAWLGVLFAIVFAFVKRRGVWLVPLAWVIGYFAFMGAQFSLYMRYFLPLYPALAVFAAALLWHAAQWASSADP
ncbi:MAG TPA: glycosyltransferase family 39 protein, partial [Candidatus Tumulicola sp.]|nr:glycosyltransferase family 39 protein [Candidatus Tumulicola sp.]